MGYFYKEISLFLDNFGTFFLFTIRGGVTDDEDYEDDSDDESLA